MNGLKLFDKSTLNIFCDASIAAFDDETIGCPGCITTSVIPASLTILEKDLRILRNSTNNQSEITAILMAVNQALKYRDMYETINIFSDSKISVYGLRTWIFNWINNINNGVMYSSSGTPVANQQIFMHIINTIVYNGLQVRIYHQKGHVTTTALIPKAKSVFMQSNNIMISDKEVKYISIANDIIDGESRRSLNDINLYCKPLIAPLKYGIDKNLLNAYKQLINQN